jgi:predicted exporter
VKWLWVLFLAFCAATVAVKVHSGGAVQTDLLAMLPETERNPVAERAIGILAKAAGERAVFLVGGCGGGEAKASARQFAAYLRASGAFRGVLGELPPSDPGAVPRFYAGFRYRLPPRDGNLRSQVGARLASPMGSLPGLGPEADPTGHVQAFLERLPLASLRLQPEDGFLVARDREAVHVLVAATLPGSAFDPGVQRAALAAVARAEADLRAAHPAAGVIRTGAVFYAEDARRGAEKEAGLISWSSLAATVLMFLLVFRSGRHLALGMACVAAGVLVAAAATLLVFGKLYLLTLVCGASMLGVAVDYPFLYFAHHLGAGLHWDARAALKGILPALLVGVGTTVLGFATLGVAPFPGLRQMALFSMAGLAASFLTLLLVCPGFLERPIPPRPRLMEALEKGLDLWRLRPWALAACAAILAATLVRLRVDDDVRSLIQPPGALRTQETRVRDLTGLTNSGRFFLVEGRGEGEVLAREEALRKAVAGVDGLDGVQAVSCFVPSPGTQALALAAWERRGPELAAALRDAGFRPEHSARVEEDLRAAAGRPLTVGAWLATPMATPFRDLWLGGTGSLALPLGPCSSERLRQAALGLPGVTLVDKADSVSALMGHYRRLANLALAAAGLLVWAMLVLRYGPRRGTVILVPAALGILAALAGSAVLGLPLTLFSTIALVLVLGFGVDYAVFLAEGQGPLGPVALGVALAGFATLLSFGLLAFSHTPALNGFGAVLGLGVLVSVLLSPLARRT